MLHWRKRVRPARDANAEALAAVNRVSLVGRILRSLVWGGGKSDEQHISSESLRALLYHHHTRGLDHQPVWRSPKERARMERLARREALSLVKPEPGTPKLASGGRRR
jgi:hypothetical protein